MAACGDKNQREDEADARPSWPPAPGALQTSLSLQNLVWAGPVRDSRRIRSLQISQSDSLVKEETPQTAGVPDREQDLDPPAPSAEAQSPPNVGTADALEIHQPPGWIQYHTGHVTWWGSYWT